MIAPVDDIDRIMTVMGQAFDPQFGEAWTRRQVEDALLVGNCHYSLIGAEGDLPIAFSDAAGFSLSRYGFEEEELLLFAVSPKYRGKGLGRRLLVNLASVARGRGARRLLLEMRRGNPAETLYRSFGFQPIGERSNYYRMMDGTRIDAVTFAIAIE
jgi:ribosomal-protein-alanine N-acetyltransferase